MWTLGASALLLLTKSSDLMRQSSAGATPFPSAETPRRRSGGSGSLLADRREWLHLVWFSDTSMKSYALARAEGCRVHPSF
jgi:hypothetical protein